MRDAPKVATLPLGLTILPLLVGAASGVGVQGLIFVLYGSRLNFDFVMSLIAFSISSILAVLICVYPIFMVFPRSRVPAAWAGTIWGAAVAALLSGLLFTWERDFVARIASSGAVAGLVYARLARRWTLLQSASVLASSAGPSQSR